MYIFGGPDEPPPVEGVFLSRPNRFIIIAKTGGKTVKVHCPNPGRLWELFHPGRKLLLTPADDPKRRTAYSLAAVEYKEKTIPMNAARSNRVAEELILPLLFPGADRIKREFSLPRGLLPDEGKTKTRFDFLVENKGEKHLIEVKSCTLTEEGIAMFPDAPTERGRRHVEELSALTALGEFKGHIIFTLHHRNTRVFIPNFYTDPQFSFTLRNAAEQVDIHAVSVETKPDGRVQLINPDLPVEFGPLKAAEADRGFFIILYNREGWYLFIEEHPKNLTAMMNQRLRKKSGKETGSTASELNRKAAARKGIAVYSFKNLGDMAFRDFAAIADEELTRQDLPLLFFKENPLFNEDFSKILFSYRHKKALSLGD